MNIQAYIESGVIEAYCAGLLNEDEQAQVVAATMLYPEIKLELAAIELAMEKLCTINAITPASSVKQAILSAIGCDAEPALDINNMPVTGINSSHEQWLNALAHLIPTQFDDDFLCEVLQQNMHLTQMLVVSKNDVPEETHADIAESFFILKGECECTVGDHLYKLSPGDFLDIPLHVAHNVKITSPYVVAILQHIVV